MDSKQAKLLLTGIVNNDEAMIKEVITAAFEAAVKPAIAQKTKSLMESIGSGEKNTNLVGE